MACTLSCSVLHAPDKHTHTYITAYVRLDSDPSSQPRPWL